MYTILGTWNSWWTIGWRLKSDEISKQSKGEHLFLGRTTPWSCRLSGNRKSNIYSNSHEPKLFQQPIMGRL